MSLSLNNLRPAKGSTHKKKRLGRGPGTGLGKTAGRGLVGLGDTLQANHDEESSERFRFESGGSQVRPRPAAPSLARNTMAAERVWIVSGSRRMETCARL